MSLPEELTAGLDVTQVTPVHGGDIARAYRLNTSNGPVFLKTHPSPTHLLFEREARGLRALREAATAGLRVPEVLVSSPRGLVLEWIDGGPPQLRHRGGAGRGPGRAAPSASAALRWARRRRVGLSGVRRGGSDAHVVVAGVLSGTTRPAPGQAGRRRGPAAGGGAAAGRLPSPEGRRAVRTGRAAVAGRTATCGPGTAWSARTARTGSSTRLRTTRIASSTWQ